MNSTSRLGFGSLVASAFNSTARVSRAQFSPLMRTAVGGSLARATTSRQPAARGTFESRDAAERAFLSRWLQPGFLMHAEPALTRYRE